MAQGQTDQSLTATSVTLHRYADGGTFLAALYHDLLNRAPDATSASPFLSLLNAASLATRGNLADTVLESQEYRQDLVEGYYQRFLNRPAASDDLNLETQALNDGATDEQVMAQILGSDEFLVTQGAGTNDGFLDALYSDLLDRPIAPMERSQWDLLLSDGTTRVQVAADVLASPEYLESSISSVYLALLLRYPTPSELATALTQREGGMTDEQLIGILVGLEEYFEVRAGETNDGFLDALYHDLLMRPVDPSSRSQLDSTIASSLPTVDVASAVLGTTEYLQDLVAGYFQTFLHRPGTSDELSFFVQSIQQDNATDEQTIAIIMGTPEYLANRGGNTNDGFLDALFQDLLGRPIDPASLSLYDNALANGTTRQQIASSVLSSQEYLTDLVSGYYTTYLMRPATASELNSDVTALQQQSTDEQLLGALLGSPEYYSSRTPGPLVSLLFTGVVANFTDADPSGAVSNYQATIDWGDGTPSTGTLFTHPSGGFSVVGSHSYVTAGPYSVTVTINDVSGSETLTKSAATVDPVLPGDVNHDGVINLDDVQIELENVLGFRAPTAVELAAGDVLPQPGTNRRARGDGVIGADDLNWIFRQCLGLSP